MKLNYKRLDAVVAACAILGMASLPLHAIAGGTDTPLTALASPAAAQADQCTGTVVDNDGEPLIGATVQVEGTTQGVATDIDGKFVLNNVKKGAKIKFSYIGCTSQTLVWNGTPLSVTLSDNNSNLDELVVVGYGVQKKVNLTGAVSSVKGEDLQRRPVADAAQMLQGMVPGLTVTNGNSGRPGGSASIQVRGQGNLSGSGAPYVLVDGVEMDLSDVNPNDIESISVLKDAGASSIYGARAAYGVILVTTKRGEEGKMRVSYQGTFGWNQPTKLPNMLDGYEFATMWNEAARNAGVTRLYSDAKLELLKKYRDDPSSVDPWQEVTGFSYMNPQFENSESGIGNTDYFDLHYKKWAFKQNHNISASGGGKKAQYYISGGYYGEDGILRFADMSYKRYNFATSVTSEITKWFKIKSNVKFMHSDTDTPFGGGALSEGFYHSLARFRPTVNPVDMNGNYTELSLIPYLQSGSYNTTTRDRIALTLGVDLQPVKNWHINADYTYKYMGIQQEALNVAPEIFASDGETTSKGVRGEMGVQADGKFTRSSGSTRYQNFNVNTSYNINFLEHNNFSVLLGYQSEVNRYNYMTGYVTGLYSTANPGLNLGSSTPTLSETRNSWATRGWFGRINYDYDSRYILELNGRYDGTSRFAKNNRWGFFPSVALAWNIANEKFMESTSSVLNNLKLRASIGRMGNQAGAGLYTFASTMGVATKGSYWFGDSRLGYIGAPGVVSSDVTWEKVESKNIGIDFGLFHNALSGSFEVYQRNTKDMLGPGFQMPDFFGASAPQANNCDLRDRGWELNINWQGHIGKDIYYSVGGSVSDYTSVVTKYPVNKDEKGNVVINNPAGVWYPGRPVGDIWGLKSDGLIQTQEQADKYNQLDLSYLNGGVWTPGDVMYRDLDGNNAIDRGKNVLGDTGDYTVIGNTTPRYQYTINASIGWKGLHLSIMMQGVGKRDYNPGAGSAYFWGWSSYAQATFFKEHLDYWSPDNTDAYYPKPYLHTAGGIGIYQNRNKQTCDRYLQNAAYLRCKNLSLSYDLPKNWVNAAKLQKVQVFFSAENLWTWTKMSKIFDPEAVFLGNGYTNEAGKNYPLNRVLSCGLTVNL